MSQFQSLVLKHNNTFSTEFCVICEGKIKCEIPVEIFIEGGYDPVCENCAKKHSPEILHAKHAYYLTGRDFREV